MKTKADLLVNGLYKKITIWDALDLKQNRPELWEVYKENLFSRCKKPENKVRLVFQTGKNGVYRNSYFRFYKTNNEHIGEGSEESYRHEFFKECISRIKRLEIRWKGEALTIYPDEILQEETIIMDDGNKRIVDLLILFKKAEPSIYAEKWEGRLAIEINDTHPVDNKKIYQMKQSALACLEFTVNKWRIKEDFSSAEDEENQIKEIVKKLEGENGGYIRGELLVDPISKKYFGSKLYEDERREKEKILSELYHYKKIYGQLFAENEDLKKKVDLLNSNLNQYKESAESLKVLYQTIKKENESIKSCLWYKLLGKRRIRDLV